MLVVVSGCCCTLPMAVHGYSLLMAVHGGCWRLFVSVGSNCWLLMAVPVVAFHTVPRHSGVVVVVVVLVVVDTVHHNHAGC